MDPNRFYPALADRTRRRLLALLAERGELCVCDLTAALAAPQPTVSRHLAELKGAGLIAARREGRWMYYQLVENPPGWMRETLVQLARALADSGELAEDLDRLAADLPGAARCQS